MREFWTFEGLPRDRCALTIPGAADLSYGDLSDRAETWATRLQQLTGGRRCLVALEFDVDPEAIAAYLGALRVGCPVLILEPGQLAAGSRFVAVWQPEVHIPAGASDPVLCHPAGGSAADPHPDLRVLLSTSGSTGDPKLVRLSGRNIASNATAIADYLGLTPDDRAAVTLPFHYSYGLSVLNSYLAAGASLLLTRHSVTEPSFWDEARAAGVTSLALVPHQVEVLAHGGFTGAELASLRYITQAGGKLAPELVRRFEAMGRAQGWRMVVMYGQTEASPRISYVPPEDLATAHDTIGRPIPGGRIWLADESGAEITGTGQPGELVYEGPNVMMGYAVTRDDLTRGAELADLRTGDVAERTEAGYFRIVGRMKRFAKLYGLRISLDQIEAVLSDRGMPAQAVALDDRLVILHRTPGQGVAAVTALAAEYDLPAEAFHAGPLPEVPLLSSGKPDQAALRRIAGEVLEASLAARRDERAGETLADILARATRSPRVGPGDSFNSLGGDSLSYLQVQLVLEERLGRAPQGWEDMPLAELEALARDRGADPSSSVHIGIDVPLRLAAISFVVIQHATDYALFGGTWMLIALMGFAMARFQLRQISAGEPLRLAARLLHPILPLYFLLLAAYEVLRASVPASYLLLVGNYRIWPRGSLLEVYWFVSVYAQLVLALALVAAVPVLRAAAVGRPWASAALASAGTVVALAGLAFWQDRFGLPYHPQRGFVECLSVFLLGWMLSCRQGPGQLAATGLLGAAVLGLLMRIDMSWTVFGLLLATLVLLAFNPMVAVPRAWGRALTTLASVTLFVYLLHEIFVFALLKAQLPQPVTAALALVVSFALAIVARGAFEALDRWLASGWRRIAPRSRIM
jgi:acyl-CoA synthetase (AMP-forming)/AMP-acid ligase II